MKKLLLGSILAVFLLLVSGVSATVTITGITPIAATEDTAIVGGQVTATTDNAPITLYALTASPSGMTIDAATGALTWTPTNDHVGSNDVEVEVTDVDGTVAGGPFVITVTNVNDAPVLDPIGNKEVYDEFNLQFTVIAKDADVGDSLILTASNLPTGASFVDNGDKTGSFSWTPTDEQWGTYKDIEFKVSDVALLEDSENITITVDPAYCNVNDETKIKIGDIDLNENDYRVGDTVIVDINDVENTGTEDLEDVEVEVCLYNVDRNKQVEKCWEAEGDTEIKDGEREDYELEFVIPNSDDIREDDDYILIVSAEGEEDRADGKDHCVQKSEEIEIEREKHDVIVKSVTLSPTVVEAGETVQVAVRVENIGTEDEDDCYVVLRDNILGIDFESNRFDLEDYTDSDNDHTVRFTITIPKKAKAQNYELNPMVYFDDGEETNDGFATLKVEGEAEPEVKPVLGITSTTTVINATEGKDVSLHLVVTNGGDEDSDATVELSAIGDWAEDIAPEAVSLHPGGNNIYLPLTLKAGATEGMHTATVTVKPIGVSEFDVKQTTLSFEVTGELEGEGLPGITGGFAGVKGSSVFWIIGDIVLVIIALFFIKAIFFGRKKVE